jgi:nicotinate dehydrogenase subunit B
MSTELSPSFELNPDLDTWVRVDDEETITVFTGKVELGQGIVSALARVAAEELDVDLARIRVATADTAHGPDEGITAGSMSMPHSGRALRQATAEARTHLLALAAAKLGAELSELLVEDGVVRAPDGRTATYWELLGGGRFGVRVRGDVEPKRPERYRLVGRTGNASDIVGLVTGTARFVQDLAPSGVVHARILLPPSQSAVLEEIDEDHARSLPGLVALVRDGGFVGVVAEREEQAQRALEALRAGARWREEAVLPPRHAIAAWLLDQPTLDYLIVDGAPVEDPVPAHELPAAAAVTLEATFTRPYQMHASIGPSAALAEWRDGTLTVWTHSQAVPLLRTAIAQALGLDPANVHVTHVRGPGSYGHNGADDAAYEAALLAQAVPGRPILLKWTREDEHRFEPYAPPAVIQTSASLDANNRLLDWSLEAWGTTHNSRPFPFGARTGFASAWRREPPTPRQPATPLLLPEAGIHRNATPIYRIPNKRIVKHFVAETPLRTSSTRSLGAFANVFAIESTIDDLAHAAGVDALAFRLAHLDDERARDVLVAAAERAGWAENQQQGFGRGSGIGFARYKNAAAYAAVIVAVTIDDLTAQIVVDHAVIAADAGQVVDPGGLENQLEGGLVQALSWTLKEAVDFDRFHVTSTDWDTYPILTFAEVPEIDTVLVDRPGAPYLGAGEATQGPTVAAVANAVRNALGVRLLDLPFTPERVREAVAASPG